MKQEILRTVHLTSGSFGKTRIEDINLFLPAGSSVGIIGRNGAGKAHLAAVLRGDFCDYTGQILLQEQPANRIVLQQQGAHICRSSKLLASLSVPENLFLGYSQRENIWNANKIHALAADFLTHYGLENHLDAAPAQLPLIAHHRLLLLQAMLLGKKFIIVESAADQYSFAEQLQLLQTIQMVCQQGLAVVYSSRQFDAVQSGLDQTICMANGRFMKRLPPAQVHPETLQHYLSIPGISVSKPALAKHTLGNLLLTLLEIPIYRGSFMFIEDCNGTAGSLIALIEASCASAGLSRAGIIDNAALDSAFIDQMSIQDNLFLSAAPKISNPLWHASNKMKQLLRNECLEQTGLSEQQLALVPKQLTRLERLRVLLYRFSILGVQVCIIDRPGANDDDRFYLEIATNKLLASGCAVIYIANAADEPFRDTAETYYWKNHSLSQEVPI